MTPDRIAAAFDRARRDGRAAFIPFLTAGDPSPQATVDLAVALDRAGADVLELGVPFSDPIADGPVLQRSAARALARGTTLSDVWRIAARIRRKTSLGLVRLKARRAGDELTVVLNRLFNKLQYKNEELTTTSLGADFHAEAESEIDSLFKD